MAIVTSCCFLPLVPLTRCFVPLLGDTIRFNNGIDNGLVRLSDIADDEQANQPVFRVSGADSPCDGPRIQFLPVTDCQAFNYHSGSIQRAVYDYELQLTIMKPIDCKRIKVDDFQWSSGYYSPIIHKHLVFSVAYVSREHHLSPTTVPILLLWSWNNKGSVYNTKGLLRGRMAPELQFLRFLLQSLSYAYIYGNNE